MSFGVAANNEGADEIGRIRACLGIFGGAKSLTLFIQKRACDNLSYIVCSDFCCIVTKHEAANFRA